MALPNKCSASSASFLVPRREALGPAYPTRPSNDEIKRFAEHVRKTGCPETFDTIVREPPPEGARPEILRKFDVDRKLRPSMDEAPCAICSPHKPKCLHGMMLVYYPDEGSIRAIGPECGLNLKNSKEYREALVAFDLAERRKAAETTIESLLPGVREMRKDFYNMGPAIEEAQRLYRKLSSKGKPVLNLLKKCNRDGGRLTIEEALDKKKQEGNEARDRIAGPAGFRSSSGGVSLRTRSHNFGPVAGRAMLAKRFKPREELGAFTHLLSTLPDCGTVEEAFDWLCNNEDLEEMENVARLLRYLMDQRDRMYAVLDGVADFFTQAFFYRLNEFGRHPEAPMKISATVDTNGVYELCFGSRRRVRFLVDHEALKQR